MQRESVRRIVGVIIAIAILAISFSPQMQSFFLLPGKQKVSVGDPIRLRLTFPSQILGKFIVQLECEEGLIDKRNFSLKSKEWPIALAPGTINMYLKLFGIIPVKEMVVDVLPAKKVVPSGHSIGVVVKSRGVMVVGFSSVMDENNNEHYPAKEAGIAIGDIITKANSIKVNSDEELAKIINKCAENNKKVELTVKRNNRELKYTVEPNYCHNTESFRIGLYVRDTAAGVGTMTFFDPDTKKYAALGHIIANGEIQGKIKDGVGRILGASIQGVQQGKRGRPGEKIGVFMNEENFSGIINRNTRFGIYGTLENLPDNWYYEKPIPIAYSNQIKEGPAHILTVINGDTIEKFSIQIEKVIPHQKINGKGLIIRITDPHLLEITGGIIQGMSGSPIIQNEKLVGAITHVFVNDPTRGYGVLAEWMLEEAGLLYKESQQTGLNEKRQRTAA